MDAKTAPLSSQARAAGVGAVGRTSRTGPDKSVGLSAVTQVSSSWTSSVGLDRDVVAIVVVVVVRGVEGGRASESLRKVAALRFLEDFLSPLKVRGLTGMALLAEKLDPQVAR